MQSISHNPLGQQLHDAITAILSRAKGTASAKADLRGAIQRAKSYLAWLRRFPATTDETREQKDLAVFTFRKLIAVLESKLPAPKKRR